MESKKTARQILSADLGLIHKLDKREKKSYNLVMSAIEELEQRVARLESLFEDVIKEKLTYILQRLDQLYEKTERDKTEILAKTEKDKTELLEKIANLYAKTEKDKAEILTKTERDKKELIKWMIGLLVGFSTLIITAMWAMLSFALK